MCNVSPLSHQQHANSVLFYLKEQGNLLQMYESHSLSCYAHFYMHQFRLLTAVCRGLASWVLSSDGTSGENGRGPIALCCDAIWLDQVGV